MNLYFGADSVQIIFALYSHKNSHYRNAHAICLKTVIHACCVH
jgi:hypothetical protein